MCKMDKLFIVIPAYNEQENIEELVSEWYPVIDDKPEGSGLIIINDGSTDNTGAVLSGIKGSYPKLTVINKKNGGHGSAVLCGYRYAVDNGSDYVFQTDSDLQTDPKEFSIFWDKRKEYDAIFGFRPQRGDGIGRSIVEKVVCIMLRIFFGIKVPDANAPFRLFESEKLKKYLDLIDPEYALPNIILTAFYSYKNEKICFLPISFAARKRGKQSMNIKKIFKVGLKSLTDFGYYRNKVKNGK